MSKVHFFNVEDASLHGINKAVLMQHFSYCLETNLANDYNIKEDYAWVCTSVRALNELFPYFKRSSINRWLNELEEEGVLVSGNFNKKGYDKTKWYRLSKVSQNEQGVSQNEQGVSQNEQSPSQNEQPIQYISLNNNKDIIKRVVKKTKPTPKKTLTELPEDFIVTKYMEDYCTEKGLVSPETEIEKFKDYHLSKGSKFKDWTAAFRKWMRTATEWHMEKKERQDGNKTEYQKSNRPAAKADAWARYYARKKPEWERASRANTSKSLLGLPQLDDSTQSGV